MNNYDFTQMRLFIEKQLEKYPDNTAYINLYNQLLDKKFEYDKIVLEKQNEQIINYQNNYYKFCMADIRFKLQWELLMKTQRASLPLIELRPI